MRVSRSNTWVESGYRPVIRLARLGPQTACWQELLINTVPRGGEPIDVGGVDVVTTVATKKRFEVIHRYKQDIDLFSAGGRQHQQKSQIGESSRGIGRQKRTLGSGVGLGWRISSGLYSSSLDRRYATVSVVPIQGTFEKLAR